MLNYSFQSYPVCLITETKHLLRGNLTLAFLLIVREILYVLINNFPANRGLSGGGLSFADKKPVCDNKRK